MACWEKGGTLERGGVGSLSMLMDQRLGVAAVRVVKRKRRERRRTS